LPLPLHAGDLEHHVGLGLGIFHVDDGLYRRDAHQHEVDEKQDGEGDQCPEPLQRSGRTGELGRCVAAALPVLDHRVDHDREHHHEQNGDDQHELIMNVQRFPGDGVTGSGKLNLYSALATSGKSRVVRGKRLGSSRTTAFVSALCAD
jgi:hypothetical protein